MGLPAMRLLLLPSLMIALLLLSAADARAQSPDGGALFAKRCARCHETAALDPWLARRAGDEAWRSDLDRFLTRHHARDDVERQAIIDFLLKMPPK